MNVNTIIMIVSCLIILALGALIPAMLDYIDSIRRLKNRERFKRNAKNYSNSINKRF